MNSNTTDPAPGITPFPSNDATPDNPPPADTTPEDLMAEAQRNQQQQPTTEEGNAEQLLDMAHGVLKSRFGIPTNTDIITMAQVLATHRLVNVLGHVTQVMLGGMAGPR